MARDVRERVIVATTLDRDDIIAGLRELIAELRADGEVAGIRLVGGAALSLRYFDRGSTQDLDSLHVRPGSNAAVAAAAARVAQRHDWDPTWLNFEVTKADALPTLGRTAEWETIYDGDEVEDFYEEFDPGYSLNPRAVSVVTVILAEGALEKPLPPAPMNF